MRTFRSVLVTVGVLLLSGCAVPSMTSSPLLGGSGAEATQEQPQAGPGSLPTEQNSRSGQNPQKGDTFAKALGAGSFAPEEQGNALFNPCEEITKEQWESLGWDLQHLPDKESSNYVIHCMLKSAKTDDSYSMLSITTDNSKYDDVIKHGKDLSDLKVTKPENVYVYDQYAESSRDSTCSAGVVTNRGRLGVALNSYASSRSTSKPSKEEVCQQAVDNLTAMLNLPIEVSPQPTKKATPKSSEKATPAERPTQSGRSGQTGSSNNA